jgi:hypothetical protein
MSPSASELLFESEAALRMVDSAIDELHERTEETVEAAPGLRNAQHEIEGMLENVRASRDVLEPPTVASVSHLQAKLMEVSSVSEHATRDILDGLEGALSLVDALDAIAATDGDSPRAQEARNALREELFGMMQPLQFQDITTQQLAYASHVIVQMEDRLTHLVSLFDPSPRPPVYSVPPMGRAFDPNATCNTGDAQARVDEQLRSR